MVEKFFRFLIDFNMLIIAVIALALGFFYNEMSIYFFVISAVSVIIDVVMRILLRRKASQIGASCELKEAPFIIRINILQVLGATCFVVCLYFAVIESIVLSILAMLAGALLYGLQVKIQNYD